MIASYNNQKMVTSPVPCKDGKATWNKQFTNIPLSNFPSKLKLKLYNKQRTQILDLFLGETEVEVTCGDVLKLPLRCRKGFEMGELIL